MAESLMSEYQPSITEWLATIGEISDANKLREEDNKKAERLELLFQTIGLPNERPEKLSATDLTDMTSIFQSILDTRGDELCAIRLVPKKEGLPKLRNRGMTIRNCYEKWYVKQDINPEDYFAFVCPHTDRLLWSAIFVVNEKMIFGEIVRGQHYQLTHGSAYNVSACFIFDFKNWTWSNDDKETKKIGQRMVDLIKVDNEKSKMVIKEKLNGEFSQDYLKGYFEAVIWPDNKIYYVDYNRLLTKYFKMPPQFSKIDNANVISGTATSSGVIQGKVVLVKPEDIQNIDFASGNILVCENTDTRYLPIMRLAGAIITDKGGLLSHAAIVARELKKPCIVGTRNATTKLKSGDRVEVNATDGVVKIIS